MMNLYENHRELKLDLGHLVKTVKKVVYDFLLKNPLENYKLTDEIIKESIKRLVVSILSEF